MADLDVTCLRTIDAAKRNEWNHVVEQSRLGSVFHRYEWLEAIERGVPREARHLVLSKDGNPIGLFPNFVTDVRPTPFRRLHSLRPGHGGPIFTTEEDAGLRLFFETISQVCTGRIRFVLLSILDPEYVRYHGILREMGYGLRVTQCSFVLDLTKGWDAILADMDSSRRRAIRNGHEREVEIVDEAATRDTLAAVHDGYSTVMDRVGGKTWPRSFFLELEGLHDRVKVSSLHVDGERRGMLLFVLDTERSTLHYLFPAITRDHFKYNASELLHEHAIRWGIENGFERYGFGVAKPTLSDGLFKFKEQFGATERPRLSWERGFPSPMLSALNAGRYLEESLTT